MDHPLDMMMRGVEGTKEIFMGIEDIQEMESHYLMITMAPIAVAETIETFHSMTRVDRWPEIAVETRDGGTTKEIGIEIVREKKGVGLMAQIAVKKKEGDMMREIVEETKGVDTMIEIDLRKIDADTKTEVIQKMIDVDMAIGSAAGKIDVAKKTGIGPLMIEISGGTMIGTEAAIETDILATEIVEKGVPRMIGDEWMTTMFLQMITTGTEGQAGMVMIIEDLKVGVDVIVTIIEGTRTDIQGDGMKETRDMEGMSANQNDANMTVLPATRGHGKEMTMQRNEILTSLLY